MKCPPREILPYRKIPDDRRGNRQHQNRGADAGQKQADRVVDEDVGETEAGEEKKMCRSPPAGAISACDSTWPQRGCPAQIRPDNNDNVVMSNRRRPASWKTPARAKPFPAQEQDSSGDQEESAVISRQLLQTRSGTLQPAVDSQIPPAITRA